MSRKIVYTTLAAAFLSASLATSASAGGLHNVCEQAMKGMLTGVIGASCAEAEIAVGAECMGLMAEMTPYDTIICAGAGGAVASVCVATLTSDDIKYIADKSCEPVEGM
jgi:hypothetical protein